MSMFTNGYVYDFEWLCQMMKARIEAVLYTSTNAGPIRTEGIINGIRPEDGSGNHWLVTILRSDTKKCEEVYIRTA